MPQRRSDPPIGRMTWGRAVPVLIACVVFDALRMFFEWFWFFGPALAGVYCTAEGSAYVGTTVAGLVCGAGATVAGYFASPALTAFGVVMAMAVGLIGWGTVTLILAIINPRIWHSNVWGWVWSVFSLAISETPFLGTIPMLTITHWRLYVAQISKDKKGLLQYKKEQAALQVQERRQQAAELMQAQQAQLASADVY